MKKIIIDIGSANTKSYLIDENNKIDKLDETYILLKKGFNPNIGLDKDNEKELFKTINKIKSLYKYPIYVYATGVFRVMNEDVLNQFKNEFKKQTKLNFNMVNPQEEIKYITDAVSSYVTLTEPILICSVGGGSTEIIIKEKDEIIEDKLIEFGVGDINNKFPDLAENYASSKISDIMKYIKENIILPNIKVKYAFFTGGHLKYTTTAKFPLEKNIFFNNDNIPYCIKPLKYKKSNNEIVEERDLNSLKEKHPDNPDWFNGARACALVTDYIINNMGIEWFFPTDINMISGIVESLKE